MHKAGWRFLSITIDGKRGYYQAIRKLLGNVPIQMCMFHQKAIMLRYITDKPQSACGKDLKELMGKICYMDHQEFIDRFYNLLTKYKGFLNERNEKGAHKHGNIRAAVRSMQKNMHMVLCIQTFRN